MPLNFKEFPIQTSTDVATCNAIPSAHISRLLIFKYYGSAIETKVYPRADGAKCRARVLIPPGYLHAQKGKH